MLSSRIRQRAFAQTAENAGAPLGLWIAAGVGGVIFLLCVWVVATMNTPPAVTPVKAELSLKL